MVKRARWWGRRWLTNCFLCRSWLVMNLRVRMVHVLSDIFPSARSKTIGKRGRSRGCARVMGGQGTPQSVYGGGRCTLTPALATPTGAFHCSIATALTVHLYTIILSSHSPYSQSSVHSLRESGTRRA